MKIKELMKTNKIIVKIYAQLKAIIDKKNYQVVVQYMLQFFDKKDVENKKIVKQTIKDAFFCEYYYKITYQEYFLYKFRDLSDKKRKEFIGDIERHEILDELEYNNKENTDILDDKYKSYLRFKEFYKRDVIKIKGKEDRNIFEQFCEKHQIFIVKPINLFQGKGVFIINQKDYKSLDDIWNEILKHDKIILEELIIQDKGLGKFHPESVNTVRFATYTKNNTVTNLFAVLRMGQGNSVVDNACAGGIVANIDLETGIINTEGKDYIGNSYLKHPSTNICIMGQQIPKWDELLKIVEQVAKLFPEYKYISWDFALSEKGWVIVETNSGGTFRIHQVFNGLRKKYEEAIKS